jgi:hypothetical protein
MGFLRTAVAAAALYAVAVALAPEREGIKKACVTAFSLFLILALLPQGGFEDLTFALPLPDEEAVGEEAYAEEIKRVTEESMARELRERFSVAKENLSLSSDFSYKEGKVTLTCVTVHLSRSGVLSDVPALVRHVEENYKIKCEVRTDGS